MGRGACARRHPELHLSRDLASVGLNFEVGRSVGEDGRDRVRDQVHGSLRRGSARVFGERLPQAWVAAHEASRRDLELGRVAVVR